MNEYHLVMAAGLLRHIKENAGGKPSPKSSGCSIRIQKAIESLMEGVKLDDFRVDTDTFFEALDGLDKCLKFHREIQDDIELGIWISGEVCAVETIDQASKRLRQYIDDGGYGSSDLESKDGIVFMRGKMIGHVSYNGRYWTKEEQPINWLPAD